MPLELIDITLGLISLAFVLITFIVGFKIISQYFKYGAPRILLVGLAWIGIASPWIPDALTPLYILIDPNKKQLWIITFNLIVNNVILPIPVLLWLIAFTKMLNVRENYRKLILILTVILSIFYEIFLIYFYLIDLQKGIEISGYLYISDYIDYTLIIYVLEALITGLLFSIQSIKSEVQEVKLKGKLLMVAFIFFTIGAMTDALYKKPILNIYSRLILVISSVIFYMGFAFPKWVKKILLK
ncbi:MAG: hypothetical protein R6U96_10000 [Promethearchaeia archaeon]